MDLDQIRSRISNGQEIEIASHLAQIYDRDLRMERQRDLITLLFETLETMSYADYCAQYHQENRSSTNNRSTENTTSKLRPTSDEDFAEIVVSKPQQIDLTLDCCICCEEFTHDTVVVRLPCQHIYHIDCLRGWVNARLASNNDYRNEHLHQPDCPSCRMVLKIRGVAENRDQD